MECKFWELKIFICYSGRINRNIVECKLNPCVAGNPCVAELIETLWNVNRTYYLVPRRQSIELIETLWNVNVCSVDTNMSSIFFVDPC